jgi:hypothetical protein
MQLYRIIRYSLAALHVSSDIFVHHQEHLNLLQFLILHTYVAASRQENSFINTIVLLRMNTGLLETCSGFK